ncbi:hypothetical protein BuS5_00593 [Desulfosarcina sp. BuS5]|nr:hypothetical protein [Desulfosarcina sp. BuS5]WDN87625.1 hypothetical protein BuS5_00593 [Desulfosarcina sp. BuS5]
MISDKWILLVLEDGAFHSESVYYAINLAKRIDCSISVLMLAANAECDPEGLNREQGIVKKILNAIRAEKVNVQAKIRYGDKASEFLKHLADNPSFAVTVWGGGEEFAAERNIKKGKNWFAKIKVNIRCPVVRPTAKDKSKTKHKQKEL